MKLIRSLYRRIRDTLYGFLPPCRTEYGFWYKGSMHRFRLSPDEVGTIKVLMLASTRSKRFINVGANAGFYVLFAEMLGMKAFAFEPEKSMFRRLCANLALNDSECIPIPVALSDIHGRANLYGTGTAGSLLKGISGTSSIDNCRITAVTADAVIPAGRLGDDIWLLDCEGSEPNVIQGAIDLLTQSMPILVCEYRPSLNESGWAAAVLLLKRLGYCSFVPCSSIDQESPYDLDQSSLRLYGSDDNVVFLSRSYHPWIFSGFGTGG